MQGAYTVKGNHHVKYLDYQCMQVKKILTFLFLNNGWYGALK